MAYVPRHQIVYDGCTFHVTWRCHNKEWLLKTDEAKRLYYDLLLKYKDRYGVKIYSYNFMSNHPHLTGWLRSREEFSDFFRVVNNLFARKYNRRHGRCGQVVMDRFKSPIIQTDTDLLRVMIYVDMNPVRQNMVKHPKGYRWTSYHYYAYGRRDALISPAPSYMALGRCDSERRVQYMRMVEGILQMEGYLKKDYSLVNFIGDPEWVQKKYTELRMFLSGQYKNCFNKASP